MYKLIIDVIVKRPGELPATRTINNSFAELQRIVGGRFDVVEMDDFLVLVNEESFIDKSKFNCRYGGLHFFGTIIFCSFDGVEDFCSLSSEQMTKILCRFGGVRLH